MRRQFRDGILHIGLKSVGLISVAEIYHNKKHFNLEHLYKITAVFDVNITDFFGGVNDGKPLGEDLKQRE